MTKILVIGDEQLRLNELFRSISRHDYLIELVPDVIDAMQKAKMSKSDIILLDVSTLNNIDLIESCKKIKKDPENKPVQLIIFDGCGDKETIAKYNMQVSADEFLAKPLDECEGDGTCQLQALFKGLSAVFECFALGDGGEEEDDEGGEEEDDESSEEDEDKNGFGDGSGLGSGSGSGGGSGSGSGSGSGRSNFNEPRNKTRGAIRWFY